MLCLARSIIAVFSDLLRLELLLVRSTSSVRTENLILPVSLPVHRKGCQAPTPGFGGPRESDGIVQLMRLAHGRSERQVPTSHRNG